MALAGDFCHFTRGIGSEEMEIGIYVAAGMLGILIRYNLGMVEACRVIGTNLSDSESDTGFQDAITPPNSTNLTIVTWIAVAGVLGFSAYQFGWGAFGISLAAFIGTSIVAGVVIIPKPPSKLYVLRIYRSMANRYADFVKNGDSVRADALKHLIDKVEEKYADWLTN